MGEGAKGNRDNVSKMVESSIRRHESISNSNMRSRAKGNNNGCNTIEREIRKREDSPTVFHPSIDCQREGEDGGWGVIWSFPCQRRRKRRRELGTNKS